MGRKAQTVIPPCEHVFVDSESSERECRAGFGPNWGAGPWVDVRVPMVQPQGWAVRHLEAGLRELERVRREAEAASAVLLAAMPQNRDSVANLARKCGISNREARRRRDVAAVVEAMAGALELLGSGAVSAEHVAALAPVINKPGAAALLDSASSKSPEDFARDVEQFRIDSEGSEDVAKRQRALRSLRFFAGPSGMVGLNGLLPPVEGTTLKNMVAALVDAQWRVRHPERAETLGGHGGDTHEQRMADALLGLAGVTPWSNRAADGEPCESGRRGEPGSSGESSSAVPGSEATAGSSAEGDSLHESESETHGECESEGDSEIHSEDERESESEIHVEGDSEARDDVEGCHGRGVSGDDGSDPHVERSRTTVQVKTAKPAVIIMFNVDLWEATLSGHGPIPVTPSLFDRARSDLYYCFQNMQGEVLKFGRSRHDPTPVQRLAVIARDKHCIYPGCHAPPERCDIHHLNEVARDQGATDVDVLGLFCTPHHRHIHLNNLVATREPDGSISVRDRGTGIAVARPPNADAA